MKLTSVIFACSVISVVTSLSVSWLDSIIERTKQQKKLEAAVIYCRATHPDIPVGDCEDEVVKILKLEMKK